MNSNRPQTAHRFAHEILQGLYASEINFQISTFWDGGFDWQLGDEVNGWKEKGNSNTLGDAVEALAQAALRHFPHSRFSRLFAALVIILHAGQPAEVVATTTRRSET